MHKDRIEELLLKHGFAHVLLRIAAFATSLGYEKLAIDIRRAVMDFEKLLADSGLAFPLFSQGSRKVRNECLIDEIVSQCKDLTRFRIEHLTAAGATVAEISALLSISRRQIFRMKARPYSRAVYTGPLSGWQYESEDLLKALAALRRREVYRSLIGNFYLERG